MSDYSWRTHDFASNALWCWSITMGKKSSLFIITKTNDTVIGGQCNYWAHTHQNRNVVTNSGAFWALFAVSTFVASIALGRKCIYWRSSSCKISLLQLPHPKSESLSPAQSQLPSKSIIMRVNIMMFAVLSAVAMAAPVTEKRDVSFSRHPMTCNWHDLGQPGSCSNLQVRWPRLQNHQREARGRGRLRSNLPI